MVEYMLSMCEVCSVILGGGWGSNSFQRLEINVKGKEMKLSFVIICFMFVFIFESYPAVHGRALGVRDRTRAICIQNMSIELTLWFSSFLSVGREGLDHILGA